MSPTEAGKEVRKSVCAFIGLLDIDGRAGENAAYSVAGTQFQECLLRGLLKTSLHVTHAYALRPVPSFPRTAKLFFTAKHAKLVGSIPTTFIGFINAGPIKTLTGGITLLPRLIAWAWRERNHNRTLLLYNLYSPPGFISILAGWLTRSRVVAIVADIQIPGHGLLPDNALRRLDYELQRFTLRHFDGLVVLTAAMAEDYAPAVPWIQMEGALPDRLLGDAAQRTGHTIDHGKADGEFVIMYSGGLSELKGIDRLLDAFALLDNPEFRLWITGMGPLAPEVAAAAKRDPRIKFWGFTDDSVLISLYETADVLVNPHSSHHATSRYLFPSKLIEYLGTGTPVISTCSTPEVASEYGDVLVVTGDDGAHAIADAIGKVALLSRADRRVMATKAREFVRTRKSWQVQADRIARFITVDLAR